MRAIIHDGAGLEGARYGEIDVPALGDGEVRVRLKTAALNHRDVWMCLRRTADMPTVVLGSDGAGVVEAIGEGVNDLKPGDEVVTNSSMDWANRTHVPQGEYGVGYKILGDPDHGTFAEYIVIGRHQLEPKPKFLTWQEAAAFPLVGITTYRALFTEGKLKAGQTVAIPGIGGGAATQALLFAKAAGARVVVTSRSEAKLERAASLGADLTLRSDSDWAEGVRNFTGGKGADVVIETVGKPTWDNSLACLANGGRLVFFGAAVDEPVEISPASLFLHWQHIIGTTMGSRDEFQDMLAFVEAHQIRPVLDRAFPLSEGAFALAYLEGGEQFGKVTLDIDI